MFSNPSSPVRRRRVSMPIGAVSCCLARIWLGQTLGLVHTVAGADDGALTSDFSRQSAARSVPKVVASGK